MNRSKDLTRAIAVVVLACFLQTVLLPSLAPAQEIKCPYDRAHPTLGSARISFKSLNYRCSEQEINDYLLQTTLSLEERADAHVLLAAVYYAQLKDNDEKRVRVIGQFKEAFKSYREWRGDLDISSTEFIDMMNEAQTLVDQEAQKSAEKEQPKDTVKQAAPLPKAQPTVAKATGESKPFYKKWYMLVIGVGLIAGAAVALGGGGGSDSGGETSTELPNFPPPPPSGK